MFSVCIADGQFQGEYINLCDDFMYDAGPSNRTTYPSASGTYTAQGFALAQSGTIVSGGNLYNYMYNAVEESSVNSEDLKGDAKDRMYGMGGEEDTADSRRRYPCPQCGTRFTLVKNMKRHFRYECGKEPQFQCSFCAVKFKRNNQLQGHILKKHSNLGS